MNRLIKFFMMASCIFMFACDDAQPIIPEVSSNKEALYDVTFNLGGFDEVSGVVTRASSFNDRFKYLSYTVFEENRNIILIDKILLDADVKKSISLKLPKGKYLVSIVASEKKLALFDSPDRMTFPPLYSAKGFMYNDLTNEVFTSFQPLVVDDQSLTQTVQLTRPIGRIQLAVNDLSLAPSEVQAFYPVLVTTYGMDMQTVILPIGFYYDLTSVMLTYANAHESIAAANGTYNSVKIAKDKFSIYNQSNPFTFYLPQLTKKHMVDASPKSIDLYLLGSKDGNFTRALNNPNIVFKKLLKKNISIEANQSIKIGGNIFGTQGLNVTLNETWSDTSEEEF